MSMIKYAYLRGGQPILDWRNGPPRQSRAADAAALGSLGSTTLDNPTLVLPAPGAPEPIGVTPQSMGCCSACSGIGGLEDSIPGGYLTLGALALGAFFLFKSKRRRR